MHDSTIESGLYERGSALEAALAELERRFPSSQNTTGRMVATVRENFDNGRELLVGGNWLWSHELGTIFSVWSHELVKRGRLLDDQLDELVVEAIAYPFGVWDSTRPIRATLDALLVRRYAVRALERDVEQLSENLAATYNTPAGPLDPVVQVMNELRATYQRAFDLCTLKLNTIVSTRATYGSIAIALIALGVALTSLFLDLVQG